MKPLFFALIVFYGVSIKCQTQAYISTKDALEDIEHMINTIEEVHYNPYFMVNKEQFNKNKNELISKFNPDSISLKRFIATGMKLVAQMSGGHTAMDWQNSGLYPELKTYKFIPFLGKLTDDQYLEIDRSVITSIKKGTLIESINGVNIVELYDECLTYFGGIESFKNINCQRTLPLYLFFTEKISAPYFIKVKGIEMPIETAGLTVAEFNSFITSAQTNEDYTFAIIEDSVGVISYNSCNGYKSFKKFLKNTFRLLKKEGITKLVIDIRENGGGDSSLNDLLLSYVTTKSYQQSSGRFWKVSAHSKLAYQNKGYKNMFGADFMQQYFDTENQSIIESPEEKLTQPIKPKNYFNGTTCFLIGPNTFSSANFLADAVKTYELSTLIGLSTGEYTNDFGEQIEFKLPNSGNYFYVSSTYDIGANGNPFIFEPVYPDIQVEKNVLNFAIDWMNK